MAKFFIQNDISADKQPENGGNGEYQYAVEYGAAIKPVFKILDNFFNDSINLFSILGQEKQPAHSRNEVQAAFQFLIPP